MYFTTTKDFTTYSKAELLLDPGFNVIDSTMVKNGDEYLMILKDETKNPVANNLRLARSKSATGPWKVEPEDFSTNWVEGPTCMKAGDAGIVYYDQYTRGKYGAMRTEDFKT